jgi:hypothetical protein
MGRGRSRTVTEEQQAESVEAALRGEKQCRICGKFYQYLAPGTALVTCGQVCHEQFLRDWLHKRSRNR